MILKEIHTINFFNHKNTKINFEDVESPTLLTGNNGSGKSSFISESLSYAIFGQTRLENLDDAIRHEEDEMMVSVSFILNGQDIKITRSKKRGKSQKLSFSIDDISSNELLSETQKRIDKLFGGLSYDAFKSSIILRQEEADHFVNMKPDERKKIIGEILNLNEYERLEKIAKEKRSEVKATIKADQNVLNSFEHEDIFELTEKLNKAKKIDDKLKIKLEKIQEEYNKIVSWNNTAEEKNNGLNKIIEDNIKNREKISLERIKLDRKKQELSEIKEFISEHNDFSNLLNKIKENIKIKNASIEEFNELLEGIFSDIQKLIQEKSNEQQEIIDNLKNNYSNLINEIKELNEELKGFDELVCQSCQRPFDNADEILALKPEKEKKLSGLKSLLNQKEEIIKLERNNLKNIQNGAFQEAQEMLLKYNDLKRKIKNLQDEKVKLEEEYEEKAERNKNYQIAFNKKSGIEDLIKNIEDNIENLELSIQPEPKLVKLKPIKETKDSLDLIQSQSREIDKAIIQIETQIENANKVKKQIEDLTNSINNNIHKLSLYEKLCIAFSRKGIPAAIIEKVLPEIEDSANEYLGKMTDGIFEIKFNTVGIMKNGETKETLDIIVHDGNTWRSFESFSGGEKFRISFSIRLALSRILSRMSGVDLSLLIIDEGGTALDNEGKEVFASIINSLKSYFEKIILITHLDLKEHFDNIININNYKE
jgi:exonuclease SbcC